MPGKMHEAWIARLKLTSQMQTPNLFGPSYGPEVLQAPLVLPAPLLLPVKHPTQVSCGQQAILPQQVTEPRSEPALSTTMRMPLSYYVKGQGMSKHTGSAGQQISRLCWHWHTPCTG